MPAAKSPSLRGAQGWEARSQLSPAATWCSSFIMAEQTLKHLVRIANTDLEGAKPLGHALLKIHGVGFSFAQMVCALAKIDRTATTGMLSDEQVVLIDQILKAPLQHGAPVWMANRRRDYETNEDRHLLGADITFTQENDIKRLKKIR